MTTPSSSEHTSALATTGEAAIANETRLSLEWLNAFDPRTFLPKLWASDRTSKAKISLSPPEGEDGGLAVERHMVWYADGSRSVVDEPHFGVNVVGRDGQFVRDTPQLAYQYNAQGCLIEDKVNRDEHLQAMIDEMSRLVFIPGSTIKGRSDVFGIESSFKSDGEKWIDESIGGPLVPPIAIAARHAIEATE